MGRGIALAAYLVRRPTALEERRANAGCALKGDLASARLESPRRIGHVEIGWQVNPEAGVPKSDPDHAPDSSPPA